ncbi:MAG TPA: Crp/Fnr family transcriptional regulator [Amaricoccus sp.]|uniref:transcriptional regulator FnrL n=1 Tax=Amaricoccus sp. TaxID=1872485 RepID=UPI002C8910B8|nr:Crp/Fnr family transcriptional regulator [Amaricoccus sp.]HMQ94342.1 Crp/Fnr family transcriptional regulator [Amaricoccus sp.]HMR52742.1 Crp/Fnr family transcriptional regulator [Amaricoccus sp.]HMR61623.1 Crp/Fnr family transcriptional regulator [Amaricoccus sp.]HMT99716.1 Crp/Fnr family transcriptional regulator [Amaricoccus sp.]
MAAGATHRPVRTRCADCPIRHRAVCSHCESQDFEELERIKTYRTYAPGETIAWAGEHMPLVGSVVDGVAMLSSTLPDGRRQMVGLLLPSDFVGRPGRATLSFDVVAATKITLCMFNKSEFERMVGRSPHIEHRLLEMTLDELDAAREWMLLLGRKTAREKIASLFVIMARRDAELHRNVPQDGLRFPLHITREAMADYLGLTIETVSRQISALRRQGLIELGDNRMVHVPDFAKLIDQSGDDADGGVLI